MNATPLPSHPLTRYSLLAVLLVALRVQARLWALHRSTHNIQGNKLAMSVERNKPLA